MPYKDSVTRKAYMAAYRAAHRSASRGYGSTYRERHGDALKAEQALYYTLHREVIRANQKVYGSGDVQKEAARVRTRKYRTGSGKEKVRELTRARRHRRAEIDCNFTAEMERCVRDAFNNICAITGEANEAHLTRVGQALCLDHVEALSLGNPMSFDNVCLLANEINSVKGCRGWEFFTPKQRAKIKRMQKRASVLYALLMRRDTHVVITPSALAKEVLPEDKR